jgi:uncharacterized protein
MLVGSRSRVVELIENLVRKLYPEDMVHGLDHVLRVRDIALKIAEAIAEPVDREVLEVAALLHDIGRVSRDKDHAKRSAEIAYIILKLACFPEDKVGKVVEAIQSHSFSEGVKPMSIEAKILSDADKLDALGVIGIARVFAFSGSRGRSLKESIQHFYDKILQLPNLLFTDIAKSIAIKRIDVVKKFLEDLEKEIELKN